MFYYNSHSVISCLAFFLCDEQTAASLNIQTAGSTPVQCAIQTLPSSTTLSKSYVIVVFINFDLT